MLADAVRIRRSRRLDGNASDLCHLAQVQSELHREAQADANRRDCVASMKGLPATDLVRTISAIIQSTLDRSDLAGARFWLAQLPKQPPPIPELALARARLAQLSDQPDAGARIDAVLANLPVDQKHRRLRWQAQSLQAAQACLSGRARAGIELRREILSEAGRVEPENARQQRRLALLSAPCAPQG